ncbi:polymer-forming cytoskeletal protein [Hwanghaeella grinnelliae]|uniref:Polymer-forming cytoskeletal protein n=1 Tax=Hwanghaeella grinnelliae TaxID=2500179 RepID=A0A437QK16_9PROT|nr:polymer-forming cytoskeletal protein [Hwanghaeella grinnelliae]RVU34856.1 polymer-forming cytoskeletal protein [Hwanghaeella grinnelliae]
MFGGSKSKAEKAGAAPVAEKKTFAPSIVSANLRITGDLESDGDIQVDGHVDGDIRTSKLTIGPDAAVNGAIYADEVMVSGTVNGSIQASLVKLYNSAKVTGDIVHEALAIEAGAFIQGLCKRVDLTPKTQAGKDAKKEVADVKPVGVENAAMEGDTADDAKDGDDNVIKPAALAQKG